MKVACQTTFYHMTTKSLRDRPSRAPAPSTLDDIQTKLAPVIDSPGSAAIFLDLDGTLAPIMPRPDEVVVLPTISRLVRQLSYRYLAVTIVSGRPATEVRRITGNPELIYIGNHGFETMLPGHAVVVCDEAQPHIPAVRELLEFSRSREDMTEAGVMVEDKSATVSLHYRRAPDPEAARRYIEKQILPKARKLGLVASEGRMVVEIKPPANVNKGVAVGSLLDRLDCRTAVYIGDDATDIDALKELRRRRRRKDTVMVGIGVISEEMPRDLPKNADLLVERVSGVELVLQILAGEEL